MTEEPGNEYLWDRSGEPDDFVGSLESLLARYRYERPLQLPGDTGEIDGIPPPDR